MCECKSHGVNKCWHIEENRNFEKNGILREKGFEYKQHSHNFVFNYTGVLRGYGYVRHFNRFEVQPQVQNFVQLHLPGFPHLYAPAGAFLLRSPFRNQCQAQIPNFNNLCNAN